MYDFDQIFHFKAKYIKNINKSIGCMLRNYLLVYVDRLAGIWCVKKFLVRHVDSFEAALKIKISLIYVSYCFGPV